MEEEKEDRSMTEIETALSRIDNHGRDLEASLELLFKKIQGVLSVPKKELLPEGKSETLSPEPYPEMSGIGRSLNHKVDKFEGLVSKVNDVIDRVVL